MIAEATMCLSREAAGFVDTHVAPVAHKIGPAQLMRLVAEAQARFDPEATEADRPRPRTPAGSTSTWPRCPTTGRCTSRATWTWPTPSTSTPRSLRVPPSWLALGSTQSLGVRRAQALGDLARAQLALGFHEAPEGHPEAQRVPRRQVVLHAHIAAAAVTGATGTGRAADLARVQEILGRDHHRAGPPVVRQPQHHR